MAPFSDSRIGTVAGGSEGQYPCRTHDNGYSVVVFILSEAKDKVKSISFFGKNLTEIFWHYKINPTRLVGFNSFASNHIKISTKSRYGLRAMICLAKMGKILPTNLIAQKEGISPDYLEKIFIKLKKAGLVKTVRGARGGYLLARPAQKITVGEILRVLEGGLATVLCLDPMTGNNMFCSRQKNCPTKNVWKKLQDALNKALDSVTLKSLIK